MALLRGLNVAKAMIDVDNASQSLANLGLRISDLDLLRNTRRDFELNVFDFHQISGLVDNQTRLFSSQKVSSNSAKSQVVPMKEVDATQDYNLAINDRLIAGAIKYSYIDFINPNLVPIDGITGVTAPNTITGSGLLASSLGGVNYTLVAGDTIRVVDTGSDLADGDYTVSSVSDTQIVVSGLNASGDVTDASKFGAGGSITISCVKEWPKKSADISTSRVSSWSPIGDPNPDDYITYGAELVVDGEYLSLTQLGLTELPVEKRYRAELPTHSIKLNVNGAQVDFPVMKGIPLEFELSGVSYIGTNVSVTRTSNLSTLQDAQGTIPFTFRFDNLTNTNQNPIVKDLVATTSRQYLRQGGFLATSRYRGQIYYPPKYIGSLQLDSLKLKEFPFIKMENLSELKLNNNSFKVVPDLKFIAPNLTRIEMDNNDLWTGYNYLEDLGLEYLEGLYTATETTVDDALLQVVSQAQIDRLPQSIESVVMRNCFKGNININYESLPNIKEFLINTTNNDTGTPKITSEGESPRGPDPSNMKVFDPSSTNGYVVNSGVGTFKITAHGFANDDIVKYDFHAYHAPGDDAIANYVGVDNMGSALSGLTGGGTYKVHSVTDDTFKLKNTNDSAITSGGYSSNGTLHSFVKWDTSTNDIYLEPGVGIEKETLQEARYRFMSRHLANSPNLTDVTISDVPIQSLNKTPYATRTGVAGDANRVKSNNDRKLYFKSKNITRINIYETKHNLDIDFSDNTNLTFLSLDTIKPDRYYTTANRTLNASQFSGCNNITNISFDRLGYGSPEGNQRARGDISAIGQGKPNLAKFLLTYNVGLKYKLNDNSFSGNNNKLYYYGDYQTSYNLGRPYNAGFGSDYWGVSGETLRTGLAFDPVKTRIRYLIAYYVKNTAGRFINRDDPNNVYRVPVESMTNIEYLRYSHSAAYGEFPSLSGKTKLRTVLCNENKTTNLPYGLQSLAPNARYQATRINNITAISLLNIYGRMYSKEFEDFGWSPNTAESTIVPWGSGTHGTEPQNEEHLIYQHTSVDNVTPGLYYQIQELGTMTKAQWENLGWVANSPQPSYYGRIRGVAENGVYENTTGANPAVGDFFLVPESKTNLNRVHLRYLSNGTQYRVVRIGPSTAPWDSRGGTRAYGSVFTASGSSTYSTGSGAIAEKTSYSNLGGTQGGKVSRAGDTGQRCLINLGFFSTLGNMGNMTKLNDFQINNNSFYGNFPTIVAPIMTMFKITDNHFTGDIPDFSSCLKIKQAEMSHNEFSSYSPESLRFNISLTDIELDHNRLPASVAGALFDDLYQVSTPNAVTPRKNINVYLKNQKGFDQFASNNYLDANGKAVRLSIRALQDIPGSDSGDPDHPYTKYLQLISSTYNWNIDIDET